MRRRKVEPESLLFNGRAYESQAELEAAKAARDERRRRLCARLGWEYPQEWSR